MDVVARDMALWKVVLVEKYGENVSDLVEED